MSRTTMFFSLLAAALLLGALAPAHAGVYRWVDKHGVVHYSDQWRPGAVEVATAAADKSSATPSDATPSVSAEDHAADQMIQHAADARAVQAREAKLRAQRCTKARAAYHQLIFARRLFTTGANGQRHYLSDAEATAARVKARATVSRWCSPPSGE
jgi:ABC-type sugar transport system substrate-binding protein